MQQLISFHGKQELKDEYVMRVKAHELADEIIKGTYWKNGKGCGVGCTVHSGNHFDYEVLLGIPAGLAIFEDTIFEALPNGEAKTFPLEFIQAVPVGKNLDKVVAEFELWQLTDEKVGLIHKETREPHLAVINKLIDILKICDNGPIPESEMKELAYRADRADRADRAYIAYRAYRADRADRADRAYIAYRAYRADRAYIAYRAYRADRAYRAREMRVKLIDLLKNA